MFKLTKQMIIIIIIIVFSVNIKANENTFNQCVNDNLTQQQTTKTQIKRLDCSNRQLNEYPNLKEFTSLKSIDLSNNNIIKFTNLTSNLNLKNLDLSGNIIYYLTNDINKLTKLESLKLNSMHLLEISNINKLVLLKNLELSNNQLFIIPSLVNNPLNRLKITNNFLNASNIKSKNKSFIVDKQQNLHLKTSILKIAKNKELFTFQEMMQRIIVSNNNIPLIGLNKYTLRDVQDSNGTNIKLSEYLDISNKNTYKNGVLTGYINLELTNYVIETNAKVVVNISGNSVIIGDDPEEKR